MVKLEAPGLKGVKQFIEVYKIDLPRGRDGNGIMTQSLRERVSILPFVNISSDVGDEYFADGLTEELISTMSKVHGLSVISRTSVMQYKGKPKPIPAIGRELNAGTILEGSVRKAGNRVRVTIQMIDATLDRHEWTESYDRDLLDIFAIQSDIASKVTEALKVQLLTNERREIEKVPTKSPEAYTLYLKGLYFAFKGIPAASERGIEYFELAVEHDPSFELAYAALAYSLIGVADESMPGDRAFPKVRSYAKKALELNERLPEAHLCMALIAYQHDWNWVEAEKSFRTALDLNPNFANAHNWHGRFLSSMGRHDEAIAEMKRAQELDPVSQYLLMRIGVVFLIARQYDKARQVWTSVLERYPESARANSGLAMLDILYSKYERAINEAEEAVRISDESFFREFLGWTYAAAGHKQEAVDVLQGLLEGRYKGYASYVGISAIYFALGDYEKDFEWLQRGFLEHSASFPMMHNWHTFDAPRKDPRFKDLLQKANLPIT